jgi:hypothetical protein
MNKKKKRKKERRRKKERSDRNIEPKKVENQQHGLSSSSVSGITVFHLVFSQFFSKQGISAASILVICFSCNFQF